MKDMRQAMLDAGFSLINEHGFAGVGLMKIINQAEGTKGSFYHYFKSKEHFGEILLADYFDEHLVKLDDFLSDETLSRRDRVRAYFDFWCASKLTEDFSIQCLVVKLAGEVSGSSNQLQITMSEGAEKIILRLAELFKEGNEAGDFNIAEPETLSRTLYGLWLGSTLMAAMQRNRTVLDSAMEETLLSMQ
ncbi:TetR/AcrR family transcriptional regulator [Vibrio echinoideorum]|jgi:TetR/AcrR family transcriptional repressor of nem operon|uniref:TetR/AcrR family transcriptional regulator n=1 Tax=Vibrio echinoideorum TaxID=2100116 RepID=UPI0002F723A2|nr:TetR/AcrR family transcriptional regulator [Vibrio echinoideorum]OED63265.1 TetR family transcriptional regulator [Vibrio splendidus ZS-139]